MKCRCIGIQKYQFAQLLKDTLEATNCKKIFRNGFKRCGLYPFDVEALDFSKIVMPKKVGAYVSVSDSETADNNVVQNKSLEAFEMYLSEEQKEAFRLNTDPIWRGISSDKGLIDIWYQLSHPNRDKVSK